MSTDYLRQPQLAVHTLKLYADEGGPFANVEEVCFRQLIEDPGTSFYRLAVFRLAEICRTGQGQRPSFNWQ